MSASSSMDELFARLSRSAFRSRFQLKAKELAYIEQKVCGHSPPCRGFVAKRLAAAEPLNDGKQTPMRGHPVFIAQHACAVCCRGCLEKWHGIPKHKELSQASRHISSKLS